MGAGAVGRAALVVAALVPALAWYLPPASPLAAVLLGALAIAAALHGLGRLAGALAGDDDAPAAIAIAWGLAVYLAIAGALTAAGLFANGEQRLLGVAGVVAGAAWCGWRAGALAARVHARGWRRWRASAGTAVSALAIAVVALSVVGWAGTWQGPFFDGEVFHLGALGRLASVGDLADRMAVPRGQGLGGNVLVSTLASAFSGWHAAHAVDRGLAFGLALALALAPIRRGRNGVLAAFVIVALASMTPEFRLDLLPRWTTVALVLALHRSVARAHERGAAPWPALLLACALATLHHGGLGAAAVIGAHAIGLVPRAARARAVAVAVAIAVLVVGGLAVAALLAHGPAPRLAGGVPGLLVRLAVWGVAAAVVHALAAVGFRELHDRALAVTVGAIAAAAALTGALSPTIAAGWRNVEPLGLGLVLLIVPLALTRSTAGGLRPATAITAILAAMSLATARFPLGQPAIPWGRRLAQLAQDGRALATVGPGTDDGERSAYAAAQAAVPPGARLGLWVDRPDLVDYRRQRIVDLRNGVTVACTQHGRSWAAWRRPSAACRVLAAALARPLDYLLVSPAALQRTGVPHQMCRLVRGTSCVDPLRRFVDERAAAIAPGGLIVVPVVPVAPPRA